jgi:hypothetical protein
MWSLRRGAGTRGWKDQPECEDGHGPPWEETASPLVSAGKAEARGPDRLLSDCFQPEPLSCLPTGLCVSSPHVDSDAMHSIADSSDSSTCLDGRAEHRDGELPMVTSALFMSFLSQGSVWQSLDDVSFLEGTAVSSEAGNVTEPESRQNEAPVPRRRRPCHCRRNLVSSKVLEFSHEWRRV